MSNSQKRAVSSAVPTKLTTNSVGRQVNSAKFDSKRDDLLSKEEEYKRVNAELEKKAATIVFEAEQVLKAGEKLMVETDYLSRISEIDFAKQSAITSSIRKPNSLVSVNDLNSIKKTINNMEIRDEELEENEPEPGNLLEEYLHSNRDKTDVDSTIMPRVANEMSGEAQIRFLKAKLKVLQEEIERVNNESAKKDEENAKLAHRCKELDEDRAKQLRISNSHQTQMEKYKKMNDETQLKVTQQDLQLQQLKKENEQLKRDTKKYQQDQQQLELRLNRALEEVEKSKVQLHKTQLSSKDSNEQEKKRIEILSSENKRLQKQKLELIQAFKKQLKLIDILKKQKMHLEAAKILQFSEEEFINALEWNSGTNTNTAKPPTKANSQRPNQTSGRPPSGSQANSSRFSAKKIQNQPQFSANQIRSSKSVSNVSDAFEFNENNHHLLNEYEKYGENEQNYGIFLDHHISNLSYSNLSCLKLDVLFNH